MSLLGYGADGQIVQSGLTVLANGYTGIGTAAFGAYLQVYNSNALFTGPPTVHIGDGQTDMGGYGMLQLVRANNGADNKAHLSFIKNGLTVFGMGFYPGTSQSAFGLVPSFGGSMMTNTGIWINNIGYVGIGTSSPGYLLNAQTASGWGIVQQQSADTGPKVGFFTGSGAAYVGTITNHNLNFCTNNSGPQMSITAGTGAVSIGGALSKGSGTFDIEHPLYPNTQKRLCHSFVEGPRCDLIYRGSKTLVAGQAIIDINKECTFRPEDAMDHGTFEALCANPDVFLQNRTGFARVIGSVTAGTLTITCESASSSDTISWMVVAERKDSFIKKWERTDVDGYLITQYEGEQV